MRSYDVIRGSASGAIFEKCPSLNNAHSGQHSEELQCSIIGTYRERRNVDNHNIQSVLDIFILPVAAVGLEPTDFRHSQRASYRYAIQTHIKVTMGHDGEGLKSISFTVLTQCVRNGENGRLP